MPIGLQMLGSGRWQIRLAHQIGIHGACGLAPFGGGPDDKQLPTPGISRNKHARHIGDVALIRLDVAAMVQIRRTARTSETSARAAAMP